MAVVREQGTELTGHLKTECDNARTKHKNLNIFFSERKILLDSLIGICSNGEPSNIGTTSCILRLFELQLDRPLHWFICMLHLISYYFAIILMKLINLSQVVHEQ